MEITLTMTTETIVWKWANNTLLIICIIRHQGNPDQNHSGTVFLRSLKKPHFTTFF